MQCLIVEPRAHLSAILKDDGPRLNLKLRIMPTHKSPNAHYAMARHVSGAESASVGWQGRIASLIVTQFGGG